MTPSRRSSVISKKSVYTPSQKRNIEKYMIEVRGILNRMDVAMSDDDDKKFLKHNCDDIITMVKEIRNIG